MITAIETALIARLTTGLGRMVRQVASYSGELDDELATVIRAFPAAWVTFAGITDTRPASTSRSQFKASGQFVVMVGERNLQQQAGRQGGARPEQVGVYPLLYAVRRLLSGQDLGLAISPLQPGKVRTLYNTRLQADAFAVFACEFSCSWMEGALVNGHWPSPPASGTPGADATAPDAHPDAVFAPYVGQQTPAAPDLLRIGLNYHLTPDDGKADAQDILRSEP